MRKTGVTQALRKVLSDIGVDIKNKTVFSDPRANGYIGVKVCGENLSSYGREIMRRLNELGYECKSIKYNASNTRFPGTRFTIYREPTIYSSTDSLDTPKKDIVYSSQIKNDNMNKIKLESRVMMLNLSSEVQVGPLKATLVAMVCTGENGTDIDFLDIENVTYNGVPVSDWRKFSNMNKEFGIDYDKITEDEFNKVFTEEAVEEYIKGLK